MTNDNRRPMSLFGKLLFDMVNDLNRDLANGMKIIERPRCHGRPFIIDPIKRISEAKKGA